MILDNEHKFSFEEKMVEIDCEISKRKNKWQLSAISYMDYEDVSQILRLHIFNKWSYWDQSRPLAQWLNRIITRQLINLVRNNYSHLSPPCSGCVHEIDANSCAFTPSGNKCAECPFYKAWQSKKQVGYNMKLASSIDSETFAESSIESNLSRDYADYESGAERLHTEMKKALPPSQWKIYEMLFVKGMEDKDVAKALNLKSSEKGRKPGYRHLFELKSRFVAMAKDILSKKDII